MVTAAKWGYQKGTGVKTGLKLPNRILFIIALGLIFYSRLAAQTFTTLHKFSTNQGGVFPQGDLILSGSTLFGTTWAGGVTQQGTVFKVKTDGAGFVPLYGFPGGAGGADPYAKVILSGTTLYGVTDWGGISNNGIVFSLNSDGTGFTNLHSFSGGDGSGPWGGLAVSGDMLYGTTSGGGTANRGTVFALRTDGTGFTNLYSFSGGADGRVLYAGVLLLSNTLYGTAWRGGNSDAGTVFAVNTDGTGFRTLHSFAGGDGANPTSTPVLSGNTLYGTTSVYGPPFSGNGGTVFRINTDGTGFQTLHALVPKEGNLAMASPCLSGNTLYGTAMGGGNYGNGTVFKVQTDGTGFAVVYHFTGRDDQAEPYGAMVCSDNMLYGTTTGGRVGYGTVFAISLLPHLRVKPVGDNLVLSWPTNFSGFTLQSVTNLSSLVWTTNLPSPAIVNGQYTVTNPMTGAEQFFRLSQ